MAAALATSCALGVITHLAVSRHNGVELDAHPWKLLVFTYLGYLASMLYYNLSILKLEVLSALSQVAISATLFNTGFFTSLVVYRLFFHRLRKFPGPKLAAVSQFYSMSLAAKDMKLCIEIQKLHQQYGDIVRIGKCTLIKRRPQSSQFIGPRYLSIARPEAIPLVYGTFRT